MPGQPGEPAKRLIDGQRKADPGRSRETEHGKDDKPNVSNTIGRTKPARSSSAASMGTSLSMNLDLPAWLSRLRPNEIGDLFANPRRELPTGIVDRMEGRPRLHQLNPADRMGTGKPAHYLSLEHIEELENVKLSFDEWWNELPSDVREAFKNPLLFGRVSGEYREYLWNVDANGETNDGLPLTAPVRLPNHVRGYLDFLSREASSE
jgi:hypothetical protein